MNFNEIIQKEREMEYFKELECFVNDQYENCTVFPPKEKIFRCFEFNDYDDVKVVIIGQDPYHDVNQANGLAFSVERGMKIPPSLVNIYKEAHDDVGIDIPDHGDLSSWAKQGVLLMNSVLTVEAHKANSHKDKGWEVFTHHIIEYMNKREKPIVFILWGNQAIAKAKVIDEDRHFVIKSPHPSPLSSYRGFFGSKPFSKTNEFLKSIGEKEIDWRVI